MFLELFTTAIKHALADTYLRVATWASPGCLFLRLDMLNNFPSALIFGLEQTVHWAK